jgi:acid phosphatase type 7
VPAIIAANSEVRNSTYGIIKFTLADGSYSWQFTPIAGKTFTDSGSGVCH